jgi:hypothetical protein
VKLIPIEEAANGNKKNVELFIPLPLKDSKNGGSLMCSNVELNKKLIDISIDEKISAHGK